MNTERIKEICKRTSNEGMSSEEYKVFNKFTDMLWEAWSDWSDELTREFWESAEKPKEPTDSFLESYYDNFEWDELTAIYGDE